MAVAPAFSLTASTATVPRHRLLYRAIHPACLGLATTFTQNTQQNRMRVTITSLALAAYATAVVARSATGDRILVVRESKYEKGYDQFFGNLVGE